jgi:uncharacterized membrane protein YccC
MVQEAVTLGQNVRRTTTIAGFPSSSWAFALRIWAAMVVGLYAAFWLQLDNASSAAATVGVLAMQTRGQAYQKAIYRILGTIIGVIVSFVIAGLFPQTRELFMIVFAAWLGLCVYLGGLLDGNRAYGALLAGYTVALVSVPQIDSPQNIFLAGINRGAAIVVGITAFALVNDLLAAPNVRTGLISKLTKAHERARALALAVLRGESAHPIRWANLLGEITALHPDITALFAESSSGGVGSAAAASAAVALVAEVRAASALASLPAGILPSLRGALGQALTDSSGGEAHRALQLRLRRYLNVCGADPYQALLASHGLDLLIENRRAQSAIEDLRAGRRPRRTVHAPIYRSHRAAVRNGLRAFLAVLICAILLSLGGWSLAAQGLAMVGLMVALSTRIPDPRGFATNTLIAASIAAVLAGVTEFLILDGVDQFPLLAIGVAPSIVAAALLLTMPNPRVASTAFLVLCFFPLHLSPTNPQDYNPETYLFFNVMAITSAILLSVLLRTVLPTPDTLRRRWYLTSAREEMHDLLVGGQSRRLDDESLFRDADRIGQLAALQPAAGDERRDDLRQALEIFGRAAAGRRVRTALAQVSAHTCERFVQDGYSALAACDPPGLRRVAVNLASTATQLDHDGQRLARAASLDLIWAAVLLDGGAFGFNQGACTC